jgi:hypothetical protein
MGPRFSVRVKVDMGLEWMIVNARYQFATGFKLCDPEPENEIDKRKG